MITEQPLALALTDHFGEAINRTSFDGKWLLVFFGFTHCRSVCPRNLEKLTAALDFVSDLTAEIQPLYITVDPARDSPEVMRAFLEERYPRFVGLTGSDDEIREAKDHFGVFARRQDEGDGNYQMPHTSLTYLVDPNGMYRAHWPAVLDVDDIGDRIRRSMRPS
ncbi:SCO family protein [Agrobacterium tumefaciens]|uniref:SCO family protein n=1 Tax=Agrobacterium tumefaciens TaxID=358 RepID=UPI00287D7480|nr:SCO family protein [Agrobacterium tumefaciens]MDS7595441.1 SCO family protein [Agrobacterium tumefaciens]